MTFIRTQTQNRAGTIACSTLSLKGDAQTVFARSASPLELHNHMNQFEADAASRMGIVRTACAAARTAVALHAAAADPLLIGRAIREARDLLDQLV